MRQTDFIFSIIVILMLGGFGVLLINLTKNHYQTRYLQTQMFLVALVIRYAASIAIYEFGLDKVLGDADSIGYAFGFSISAGWRQSNIGIFELPAALFPAFSGNHLGYYYLVALFVHLTGAVGRMPVAALNCFFGALTVVFAYRIAKTLFSNWTAVRVGWLCCVFPSLIIWSSQTLKEPVVIFLETVALLSCVSLKLSGFKLRYIIICGISVILLYPFRFYASLIVGITTIAAFLIPRMDKIKSNLVSGMAIAILVIPLAISMGILANSERQIERFDTERIQKFRSDVAQGQGSGYDSGVDMRTSSGFVLGTIIGGAHLMLAPFPWQLGGGARVLGTLPELLVWWYLFFIGLIPGVWYTIRNRLADCIPIFIFIGGMGFLYSVMFGNVGLVFRQRAQLLPWLLAFAIYGIELREIKKVLNARQHAINARTPSGAALDDRLAK